MMARMKELERENQQLKRMYAEVQMRNEIVLEGLQKSREAVLPTRVGQRSRKRKGSEHPAGLLGVLHQPDLLQV